MFCPLLAIAEPCTPEAAVQFTTCFEAACAWWYRPGMECSVLALVKELHHHLPNIAGNTAKIGG